MNWGNYWRIKKYSYIVNNKMLHSFYYKRLNFHQNTHFSISILMKHSDSNNQIEAFKSASSKSERIVGFTGAGISTESGIPDYRSKGGIWDKFQPVYFKEFISDEGKRILY